MLKVQKDFLCLTNDNIVIGIHINATLLQKKTNVSTHLVI